MTAKLFELSARYRAQIPLAALLLYLNTARSVFVYPDTHVLLTGFCFYFLMQLAYIYDQKFKAREDEVNLAPGETPASGTAIWPIAAAAALPAAYLLFSGGAFPVLLAAVIILPLYSDPALKGWRIKAMPVAKPLANVLSLWGAGVLAPILLKHPLSAALLVSVINSSLLAILLLFSLTILLDIRDVEGDRSAGLATFPVVFGVPATAAGIVLALTGSAYACFVKHSWTGVIFSAFIAAAAAGAVRIKSRIYFEAVIAVLNLLLAVSLLLPRPL